MIDYTNEEFIHLHRLNFKDWRIVDIDHYMKGNSFFNKLLTEADWMKDYDQIMSTKDNVEKKKKKETDMKEVKRKLEAYQNYLNLKEPRSNLDLTQLVSREQFDKQQLKEKET